jgi:dTDP-4-amino-4,6-dideoxygalactose transaminase
MEDPDVSRLRQRLETLFEVDHVLPVPRAALGLEATLRAWAALGAARYVAVPAIICHDVLAAVLEAGFSPVFLDVDPADGNIEAGEWARAREAGASAAIVPNLYGNAADIASARISFPVDSCLLIDDAAQAFGTRGGSGLVGGQGDVGLISFGRTKQIDVGGGGVVLCRDSMLAKSIAEELGLIEAASPSDRSSIFEHFRFRLSRARKALAIAELDAVPEFDGLLDSYGVVLRVPFPEYWATRVLRGLDMFGQANRDRLDKAAAWREGIGTDRVLEVNRNANVIPWRYTCRFPGLSFGRQSELSDSLRSDKIDVSNWYLPANWFVAGICAPVVRAERFAAEVFQFWIDDRTSLDSIRSAAAIVRKTFQSAM